MRSLWFAACGVVTFALLAPIRAVAQDNYEIQVYPGATVPAGITMLELHSNYTTRGSLTMPGGVFGSNHAEHETVEITHGFNDWFEVGFYTFSSIQSGDGFKYVGNHIRPRIAIPEKWKWPVGLSLSQEVGYESDKFSDDTWSWEIRPIIDQKLGRFYWAVNPALEIVLKGPGTSDGADFAPNVQIAYDASKKLNVALEYYGDFGPLKHFATSLNQRTQMLVPAINYDFGPDWEFNLGTTIALNKSTDIVGLKMIMGRRFGAPKSK